MDIVLIILGILLILAGFAGSILPFLPGPPLAYFGLLIQQFQTVAPYDRNFMWLWAAITVGVTVLDYVIPVLGTRRFGGTSYGAWGCAIGLVAGFWLGPFGIIVGPFLGAFIGEMIRENHTGKAFKAAIGSFLGFVAGTLLKFIVCGLMAWHFASAMRPLWNLFS